jgi:tetratricopeptide (TPR) repeat protein
MLRMSEAATTPPARPRPTVYWQVPIFAAGVGVFGFAVVRMVLDHRVPGHEEQVRTVEKLLAHGAVTRSSAYLLHLLKDPDLHGRHRGELHRLLAVTIHQAESPMTVHDAANVRSIISSYRSAMRLGAELTAGDWFALGDAYRWVPNRDEALDAYRRGLLADETGPVRVRRQVLELLAEAGEGDSPEALEQIEAILSDRSAPPADHLWAVERRVEGLLARRDAAAALALLDEARVRLNGTEQRVGLGYVEALVLRELRRPEEAEALLRGLRAEWRAQDELWGRAGWLLGRLQQEDGRPQSALGFYDEVLAAFPAGDVRDACLLGRAECLAALERHAQSLETFRGLRGRLAGPHPSRALDRSAMRTTVATIGESLLGAGSLSLAVEFFNLALEWVDPSDRTARAHYMMRSASGLQKLGVQRRGKDSAGARALFLEAARLNARLADLYESDEDAAARAVEAAVAGFEAAGQPDDVIAVLGRYVATHPSAPWRPTALRLLGQVYQSERRYGEAIEAYEEILSTYPRLPDALRSIVPLADCLLSAGGAGARRGVDLLVGIVDDAGAEQLFTPQAEEYREALFRLAEHYMRSGQPGDLERAIPRLEDALSLYPDDARVVRATFLLADAYRQSAHALRSGVKDRPAGTDRQAAEAEASRRIGLARERYEEVIEALAPQDATALTPLEQTWLRSGYLYRADCLFDLGRLEEAIAAYQEASWRFENLPAAVSASVQVVHGYQRLGRLTEATAALARLRWLLARIPASAFDAERGMSSKAYWQAMVARMERTGLN